LGACTVKRSRTGGDVREMRTNVRGEDVYVVQSTSPPTNRSFDGNVHYDGRRLRRASAMRITAVLRFMGMRGKTQRTSRGCRSRRSWWRICWWRGGEPDFDDGFARAANPGVFRHSGGSFVCGAPVMYPYLKAKKLTDLVVVSRMWGDEDGARVFAGAGGGAWRLWPNAAKTPPRRKRWR